MIARLSPSDRPDGSIVVRIVNVDTGELVRPNEGDPIHFESVAGALQACAVAKIEIVGALATTGKPCKGAAAARALAVLLSDPMVDAAIAVLAPDSYRTALAALESFAGPAWVREQAERASVEGKADHGV